MRERKKIADWENHRDREHTRTKASYKIIFHHLAMVATKSVVALCKIHHLATVATKSVVAPCKIHHLATVATKSVVALCKIHHLAMVATGKARRFLTRQGPGCGANAAPRKTAILWGG